MRHNPSFETTDPGEVKRWIREHPWITLVSATASGELLDRLEHGEAYANPELALEMRRAHGLLP